MEIQPSFTTDYLASGPHFVAAVATALCLLLGCLLLTVVSSKSKKPSKQSVSLKPCDCACTCGSSVPNSDSAPMAVGATYVNGGGAAEVAAAAERQSGASMMEQLVPEITTHALSYLDYPSLCRLSMTNSLMRKAANDDNAWKALYHKDFTLEQNSVTPVNGWKAYYAATRAIVNINSKFFNVIRERALQSMSRLWHNADYVKCVHASGEIFSGYNAVIQSWQLAFNWEQGVDFQVRDVRVRVLTDMAWVTMKTFVDMDTGPFNVTNVFEFHNGQWYMVHHHSSVMLIDGDVDQQNIHG
ncbi:F-box protein SKIP8 [Rhodamnia argentea]|uniref:F-box protein SKIP8 n=1 Tax=Rhodamnia argentea TaxID=178133 RepID=A0A8B8Q1F9_9MYRT|nr:F-box protein SKIP8 [Rhodamnia argentea]